MAERAQKSEREEQEQAFNKKTELQRDSKAAGKGLEEKRAKRTLEARIQKMKERDEARKVPQGVQAIGKSSGTQAMIAARTKPK